MNTGSASPIRGIFNLPYFPDIAIFKPPFSFTWVLQTDDQKLRKPPRSSTVRFCGQDTAGDLLTPNKTAILGNHICGEISRTGIRHYPAITTYGSVMRHGYAFAQHRAGCCATITCTESDVAEFTNVHLLVQNTGVNHTMVTDKDF